MIAGVSVCVCVCVESQRDCGGVEELSVRHKSRNRDASGERREGFCLCGESENMIVGMCVCVFLPYNGDFRLESV